MGSTLTFGNQINNNKRKNATEKKNKNMAKSQLAMAKELAGKSLDEQRMSLPSGLYHFTIGRS